MKHSSILFLQAIIAALGIGTAALLLWEPWREGVNAHATSFADIYFDDPLLALVYIGSIPFFVALYQAFVLLGYAGRNNVFSAAAVNALRMIKFCAIAIIGFIAAELLFIIMTHGDDDATGAFAIGIFITVGSIVVAATAGMFQRIVQKAVDIQSENELTV